MKPTPKLRLDEPSAAGRPGPLDRARKHAQATQTALAKRRQDQVTMWRAATIVGFAIIAVFAALEVLKPKPHTPETATVPALREQAASTAPKPIALQPAAPAANTPPAAAPPEPTAPTITPAPTATAAAEPTAAERLAAEPAIQLTGLDAQRDAARNRDRQLLKLAIEGQAWDAYRTLLGKSVQAGLARIPAGQGVNRFDPLWKEPALYQALLRWKTLAWFPESDISALVSDSYTGGFLTWLFNRNEAMEELLLTLDPKDKPGKVLKFLMDAQAVSEKEFRKYYPLALACAVVFDDPMRIPNPVGKSEYGAEPLVEPLSRYRWYIDKNEKGKLAAPVHRSSARDLVWVVSAPVAPSELEWSIDHLHLRRKNWGDAYGLVEYLMERAVEGLNPYKEYSFAEILKEGGICGDQSYFCAYTARAQGIPAMILGGETDLGGHAWVGMKIDSDEWTTGIGRIGGVSKGQASNPQTREMITEQDILLWNDRSHTSPAITLSVWRHLWLADYFFAMANHDDHAATVRLANQLGPSFTETWKALYSLLERQTQLTGEPAKPNNLDEWQAFAKDMRREFKDHPRMAELAANAELEYIFPYGSEGDAKRSLLRERRRIEHNSGEQTDLIATSLKREAELIIPTRRPRGQTRHQPAL